MIDGLIGLVYQSGAYEAFAGGGEGVGEQGKMAFISGKQRKKGQILRGTETILGNREYKKTKFEGTEEQANLFPRNKETCIPPPERASHITNATEYHQSNGIQYYSKFAIVIQAMMFKQMLVHKLFVVRSDASRFTATIYYSLFGGYVVIIGT